MNIYDIGFSCCIIRVMKGFLFHKQLCPKCGKQFDAARVQCPYCEAENQNEEVARSWKECTPLGPGRELLALFIGYFGLSIITTFAQILLLISCWNGFASSGLVMGEPANEIFSVQEISSGKGLAIVFLPSYALLFCIIVLFLWTDIKPILLRFKKGSSYLGAFIALIAMYAFNIVYGIFTADLTGGKSNQNQINVVSIVKLYPSTSLLVFGLLGPFVEECTYRLGLFNILKRFTTMGAYILSALFFAAIHFNWSNPSVLEWLNIPPYFFSGLVFALVYDKFGFGASFLAHATNNIISVIYSI